MKSFNVDFNWHKGISATSELFVNADAIKIVDYCKDLGADNLWTFCMTYNGYAWYPSTIAPVAVGLNSNFAQNCTQAGHIKGMDVFGYFCIGANTYLQNAKPEWTRNVPGDGINMIFCREYIEYFCSILQEALEKTDIDGIVIDWFRMPFVKREKWFVKEIELFEELMKYPFPGNSLIADEEIIQFDKACIEAAWRQVKATVDSVRPVKIWTNHPFEQQHDPVWENNILLQQVDYVLNESPDIEMLEWIKSICGVHTQVIQNLCGWPEHQMAGFENIDTDRFGFFGFAAADPKTCLPYTDDFSEFDKLIDEMNVTKNQKEERERAKCAAIANAKNIVKIKEAYHKF